MDQNTNNSQNEFLWKLLANPADEAHLYGFNLQRLVNDFPQSGLLQALLANASEEKNLKQASVYFNAKSLYKLINAPGTFAEVTADKIYVHQNIRSYNHSSFQEQPFIESYTSRHEKQAENEPAADSESRFEEPSISSLEPYAPADHPEPAHFAEGHLAEPLTAQLDDGAPVEHGPENIHHDHTGTVQNAEALTTGFAAEQTHTPSTEAGQVIEDDAHKDQLTDDVHLIPSGTEGHDTIDLTDERPFEESHHMLEGSQVPDTEKISQEVRTEASLTLEERLERILNEARGIPNPPLIPLHQVIETPPVTAEPGMEEQAEEPPVAEVHSHEIIEESKAAKPQGQEDGFFAENSHLLPFAEEPQDDLPVVPTSPVGVEGESSSAETESTQTAVEPAKDEYLPLSPEENQVIRSVSDHKEIAGPIEQDQKVAPEIENTFRESQDIKGFQEPASETDPNHTQTALQIEDTGPEGADAPVDNADVNKVGDYVTVANTGQHPENIIGQIFDRTSEVINEPVQTPGDQEETVGRDLAEVHHPDIAGTIVEDKPGIVLTEDAHSVLPAGEAEATGFNAGQFERDREKAPVSLPETEHRERPHLTTGEDATAEAPAKYVSEALETVPAAAHHEQETPVTETHSEPAAEEHSGQLTNEQLKDSEGAESTVTAKNMPIAAAVVGKLTQDIEDEVFDEIVSIEQIRFDAMAAHPEAETDRLIRGNAVGSDYFSFDRKFGGQHDPEEPKAIEPIAEEPVAQEPIAEEQVVQEAGNHDVSSYHDEKMPYSFMWWLNKTRKEHATLYQPFVKPNVVESIAIAKNTGDELQQQYYENIFHITSVEELDKSVPAQPKIFEFGVKRKEQAIIERFIEEEPSIKPQSSDKIDNENKAKKSSEDRDEMVTETLAGIYADQMLYHKAIASYKKLILKFPEKSRYFVVKIEELEKKTS